MARPRIFVSSTYYDLKYVRASIEIFIESLGFEPVLSEYGSIPYDPTQPLDESCYREAQSSDIFVLIVGGRYGSAASNQQSTIRKRDEEFESVTRREFVRAHDADIPVYVFIEQGVHAEYQTYLRNKESSSVKYAHVDTVKVFQFIEFIYSKQRNNPVKPFEKEADIEGWLKDQWGGLFQDLLRQRKDGSKFADLAAQIRNLEAINATLKSYLETLLQSASLENSIEIIKKENDSLQRASLIESARRNDWFDYVVHETGLTASDTFDLHNEIESEEDFINIFSHYITDAQKCKSLIRTLDSAQEARNDFNDLREQIGKHKILFTDTLLKKFSDFIDGDIDDID